MHPEEIKIDNVEYVRKDLVKAEKAKKFNGMLYVIVRTYSAGVFAGFLAKREGREVTLHEARRLWYWAGAASLSQAAEEGFSKPDKCKFPQAVSEVLLLEAVEILQCTEKAVTNIISVPVWKH